MVLHTAPALDGLMCTILHTLIHYSPSVWNPQSSTGIIGKRLFFAPVPRGTNGVPYELSTYSTASSRVRLVGLTPSLSRSSEDFLGIKGCKRMPTRRSDSAVKNTICSTATVSPSLLFSHGAASEINPFVYAMCSVVGSVAHRKRSCTDLENNFHNFFECPTGVQCLHVTIHFLDNLF